MIRDGENVNIRYILSRSTARIQTYVFHKILSGYCGGTIFQVIQQHFTSYFDSLEHFVMIKAIFVTLKCSFLSKIFSQKSIFLMYLEKWENGPLRGQIPKNICITIIKTALEKILRPKKNFKIFQG